MHTRDEDLIRKQKSLSLRQLLKKRRMKLRFLNTFEPVAPLYDHLFPVLERRGHQIDAWVATTTYRSRQSQMIRPGIRYWRIPSAQSLLPAVLHKRAAALTWTIGALTRSTIGAGTDLNVFLTQPPLFYVWGRALQALRRQPYVLVLMDLYPWLAVQAGVLRPNTRLAARLEDAARKALRGARRVIVIGRCMEERVVSLGVESDRIERIHNFVDETAIYPVERLENPLRHELGLQDQFVVMYSGNLGVSHWFDDLLEVADMLSTERDIVFLFAGRGSRRGEVETAARRLPNIRLIDHQPAAQLSYSLGIGDVHFVSVRQGFEGLVVPSKAYGIFAAGRPTIYQGSARGEVARLINEHNLGMVIPQGEPRALASAILDLRNSESTRLAQGRCARQLVCEQATRKQALEQYCAVLEAAST